MTVPTAANDVAAPPCPGFNDVSPVVSRLERLYRRVRRIEDEQAAAEPVEITATPFVWRDPSTIPSRAAGVKDAVTGLRYAAWCIGETLMAAGGLRLMHLALAAFEDRFTEDEVGRASSWLDHRWDGVVIDGEAWVA